MKQKKIKIKLFRKFFIVIGILFLLTASYFGYNHVMKKINGESKYLLLDLIGEKIVKIKYNEEYKDQGAISSYKDENLTGDIKVDTNLDINHIGNYKYKYKINYKKQYKEIERTIIVVDEDKPEITLKGDNVITIIEGNPYKELGATAKDDYDGELSDKIVIDTTELDNTKVGTYKVKYKVEDKSGNSSEVERIVKVSEKPPKNQKIPVLNYHFFYKDWNENCHQDLCLQIDKFKEQLKYLKENGYYALTMEEFTEWMYGELEVPEKSVLITIDDGWHGTSKTNGNHLIPTLEEYEMHATLFLITGWWDIEDYRSEYLDIQSHTDDLHIEQHCGYRSKVNCVSYDELMKDLKKSIEVVKNTNSFCFPFYEYTDTSIKAVKDAGFKIAFIGGWRKASRSDDKYKIPRYPIYDSTTMETFKKIVN